MRVLDFETENRSMRKPAPVNIPGCAAVRGIIYARIGSDIDIGRVAAGEDYRIDRDGVNRNVGQTAGHRRPGNNSSGKIDRVQVCRLPYVGDRSGRGPEAVKAKVSDRFVIRIDDDAADTDRGSCGGSIGRAGAGDLQKRVRAESGRENVSIIQSHDTKVVVFRRDSDRAYRHAALEQLTSCCRHVGLSTRAVEFVGTEVPCIWISRPECLRCIGVYRVSESDAVEIIDAPITVRAAGREGESPVKRPVEVDGAWHAQIPCRTDEIIRLVKIRVIERDGRVV